MEIPFVIGSDKQKVIGADIAMQLSSIAYCSDIPKTMKTYLPDWEAVWIPTKAIEGNFAFIAYNGAQYVVAIRGSVLDFSWAAFDNWFKQDFNIFEQVDWQFPANLTTKPMISKGSSDALQHLVSLVDSQGETMLDFLMKNAVEKGKLLGVTGHSLGANLSTVFAPWLLFQINQANKPVPPLFSVLTFAAPTAGNRAFANQFDASFSNSWRYHNVLDMVTYSASNILGVSNLFPPPGISAHNVTTVYKGVTMSLADAVVAIDALILASQAYYDSFYTHTNLYRGSIALNINKTIFQVTSTDPLVAWFEQAGQQHAHNHYLEWMGAQPLNCVN